jgi:hypothetical protein
LYAGIRPKTIHIPVATLVAVTTTFVFIIGLKSLINTDIRYTAHSENHKATIAHIRVNSIDSIKN